MVQKHIIVPLSIFVLGAAVVGLFVWSAPVASQESEATATPTDDPDTGALAGDGHKAAVLRLVEEGYNGADADVVRDILAEGYVGHLPSNDTFGETLTAEDYVEIVMLLGQAVADLEVTVDHIVAEGDLVATRATLRGLFDVEFYDLPPTGAPIELTFAVFHRFDDQGRIAEEWITFDTLAFAQQFES
jgi:predicted ester cyclase